MGRSDEVSGFGDLYPIAQLFWSKGVHTWMAYLTGGIPVGAYDPDRLSNLGARPRGRRCRRGVHLPERQDRLGVLGHCRADLQLRKPGTDATSGIDSHLDIGVSRLLNRQLFVGAVGYAYVQLTPDEGPPEALGDVDSRTAVRACRRGT